jgi:hypothetical protein
MVKLLPNIATPQTINITPSSIEVDTVSFYYQRELVDTVNATCVVVGNLLEVTIEIELLENRTYTFEAKNTDDEVIYKGVADTWGETMIQSDYITL